MTITFLKMAAYHIAIMADNKSGNLGTKACNKEQKQQNLFKVPH